MITVEEHNVNGGLGSLVAEVLAEAGVGIALQRLGIPDGSTPPPPIAAGCVSTMGLMPPPSLPWCKKETDGLNARCVKRGRLLLQCAKCNDLLLRRYPVQEIALLRKHKR
ncbi:Transketolase, C-terminal subunit [Serratia liquefaciens]|nr:Transketolase, C-terminal subunit [Serratia liquefaciens]